jgi:bifunctional non-homologous end joining protein LigD
MSLDEYKRKRRFEATPEPPPEIDSTGSHRYVIQRHEATRLHYDFRLEMDGVLKSWAVPKGPSLDPDDKRLAMQVEDHPVSYFSFEGIIPEGNYGAGTVMVWDVGEWLPLSPVPVNGKFVPGTDKEAADMLAKGDLKFRLNGKKLHGDFAIIRMKSRRPGTKGNEWLLIKKRDDDVVEGYDAEEYDNSALTNRSMREIAAQHDAEWVSRPAGPKGRLKAAWLANAVAKLDEKKLAEKELAAGKGKKNTSKKKTVQHDTPASRESVKPVPVPAPAILTEPAAPKAIPMPEEIHPMLATAVTKPFNDAAWLFEVKWDGYRAVAFVKNKSVRLVSRNQNDLTAQYAELAAIPGQLKATSAILDGEIVALDEEGRPSFSQMQQRTGFTSPKKRGARKPGIPILYYAFDLLYLDGMDLRKLPLEERKKKLAGLIQADGSEGNLRYSDHVDAKGLDLFEVARQKGLEGIVAKRKSSVYEERRSANWLKIKITQTLDCVVGGYTLPKAGRKFFGSVVLGLYDGKGQLIHVGQAGSGFTEATLASVWKELKSRETAKNPFTGKVEALRETSWVRPELVAEIKFGEWTHPGDTTPKLRAPVFLRLRGDKAPEDCVLDDVPKWEL